MQSSGTPPQVRRPNVRLFGNVDDTMLSTFLEQLDKVTAGDNALVVELFTPGGDADVGRRIALEIKLLRESDGREVYFIGKTAVYSAGVSIMAGFAREQRFLTRDCVLLVHGRKLDKNVHFFGPLRSNVQIANDMLAQIEVGLALEQEGFKELAEGSSLSPEEISKRAEDNWYVTASEALEHGLVAGLV